MNAKIVEKTGLGIRGRNWSWGAKRLQKGYKILRSTAGKTGEEGRKTQTAVGTSEKVILEALKLLKQKIE